MRTSVFFSKNWGDLASGLGCRPAWGGALLRFPSLARPPGFLLSTLTPYCLRLTIGSLLLL